MPQVIQHIDAIAREKERDVLFVHFEDYEQGAECSNRKDLINWLDQHGIPYKECMGLEEESVIESYMGDLYIDVPFDIANPLFVKLSEHLEDEDGEMKIPGVLFFTLSHELALELEADRQAEFEHGFGDDEEYDDSDDRDDLNNTDDDQWNGVPS
ncbi:hypothetical protein A3K93_08380 [Acinetobacter sp. NCu2D-2]|uniref:hypothetical protein n=1 Tax=Acinetobacter sp. NCu2D-2 TaxID=1608473 RepID=UPI0007CDAB91|nr:hypothetical protein [Acinetobacter sp. NCu2D-2]ANF83145.1 hypothetical protein A3K93_08380 [Acinetobacter sp. NCu2D-2]